MNGCKINQLETIKRQWKKKICIFGAGEIGKNHAYDLLSKAGFIVDCFFDNHVEANTEITGGAIVKPIDFLENNPDEYFVFACIGNKYKDAIEEQLKAYKVNNYLFINKQYIKEFYEELKTSDQEWKSRFADYLDDEKFLIKQFKIRTGYELNLDKPKTFNEKIQWLKVNYYNPMYTELTDKIRAKEIVGNIIGNEHIIPTIGVWHSFSQIDFSTLPKQFVLKCNHNSGGVYVCKDKEKMDVLETGKQFDSWMKENYYWPGREWNYKDISPKIFAEEYIENEDGSSIDDYKIFCFEGKAKAIQVDFDRFTNHRRNLYTTDWDYIDGSILYPNDKSHIIPKPEALDKMLFIAEKLSQGFPHARVDLYYVNHHIYFGEITFFHGSGYEKFTPPELGIKFGSYLILPNKEK
ncbi:MAG: glycosyl transferase [Pseudobutyrivibrio sp.]|nr:glycosyl transferase [Pseudobutyrivibrio sp.]